MAEIVCPRCGHPNSVASNFCSSCGLDLSRLAGESTDTHSIDLNATEQHDELDISEPAAGRAELVVRRGARAGSRYAVDAPIINIGRHPESEIFLDDVTVSRRHAEVRLVDDHYTVADVGSLNGTYLNRERVEEARLTSGDELQIGKFKLVFLVGDPA